MKLSMRIRVARQYAKLSQSELAIKLGVSRGAVANWECADGGQPATVRLETMALVTHVSYEWLATGRGRMIHMPTEIEIPAIDADLVWDLTERRLLQAFRDNPPQIKVLVLQMAESHATKVRKTPSVGSNAVVASARPMAAATG